MSAFSNEKYAQIFDDTFIKCKQLGDLKGGEYAAEIDRLDNFRRGGVDLELPMEAVWYVYTKKHWDAITTYVRDTIKGRSRQRLETLDGRVDDIITYLILFKCMLEEHAASVDNTSAER